MKLVFDTSALRNVIDSAHPTRAVSLSRALQERNAEVWVPASVRFELYRQADARGRALSNGTLVGAPFGHLADGDGWVENLPSSPTPISAPLELAWLDAAWMPSGRLGGGYVPFSPHTADALMDWFRREEHDEGWFLEQKLKISTKNAKPALNGALGTLVDAGDLLHGKPEGDAKLQIKDYVRRAIDTWNAETVRLIRLTDPQAEEKAAKRRRQKEKPSGTIDWLHLGIALEKEATLVSDDTGPESPPGVTINLTELLTMVGL